jgi:glycosyltransferase involved in cell wall biosynthesis
MTKKILLITDNLPKQINGVVTTYSNIERYAQEDGYRFETIHAGLFTNFGLPQYPEIRIALPWKIGSMIELSNADHVHIATEGPVGLAAKLYLDRNDIPYTTAYHTRFADSAKEISNIPESFTWRYIRWFHSNSSRVLTTTETMVRQLRENGLQGNIVAWTRGVDRAVFNPTHRRADVFDDKIILLSVGRVSREKNLEAFCELQIANSKKIVVGDGPYRKELEERYPDVEFIGYRTGEELAKCYANADVFVFTSKSDTFGIVIIESMACGTPVAAYPVEGPIDIIEQYQNGAMDEDLTRAVKRCLSVDREETFYLSKKWTWKKTWDMFRDNLVDIS